eukprot:jgi/Mesvir1/14993/Mv14652-RA.1
MAVARNSNRAGARAIIWAIVAGVVLGGICALTVPAKRSIAAVPSISLRTLEEDSSKALASDPAQLQSLTRELASVKSQLQAAESTLEVLRKDAQQKDNVITQLAQQARTMAENSKSASSNKPASCLPGQMLLTPDPSGGNPELRAVLERVAAPHGKRILAAVSNYALVETGMLQTFLEGIAHAQVPNYLIVALDDRIAEWLAANNHPYWRARVEVSEEQRKVHGDASNHAISGLKYAILREFLLLGYDVLLSDVDIVVISNPFPYLVGDSDVEGLSDGFDDKTSYGYGDWIDDPKMGWSRYAVTNRVYAMNSGLFFIRATVPSLALVEMVRDRITRESGWDQAIWNEELFFPSRPATPSRGPAHKSPGCLIRIMDRYLFMNSKVLFKEVRRAQDRCNFVPSMIHVNYHPDKHIRMKAIVARYLHGDKRALDQFPDGSEPDGTIVQTSVC